MRLIIITLLLLNFSFCSSGDERNAICDDKYQMCNRRCDKRNNTFMSASDMQARNYSCHATCQERYTGCLDRVEGWNLKVVD